MSQTTTFLRVVAPRTLNTVSIVMTHRLECSSSLQLADPQRRATPEPRGAA